MLLLCAPLLASGCASGSYAGIPLAEGAADPALQGLAHRARAGDKQAQLELGIRYEEGRGVPADRLRAAQLYRQAASAGDGGTLHIYSPPVGEHGSGEVIAVDRGFSQPASSEAAARLAALGDPAAAASVSGVAAMAQSPDRRLHLFLWSVPDVYQAVLDGVLDARPLDPDSIHAFLLARGGRPSPPARLPAAAETMAYSCAANDAHMPEIFLAEVCGGADAIAMHAYNLSPSPNPMGPGDPRRDGMTAAEVDALEPRLGAFLLAAARRRVEVADLWQYPEFAEPRSSSHLPIPLNARLVMSRDRSSFVVIYSHRSQPQDPAGDRIQSLAVFSRR